MKRMPSSIVSVSIVSVSIASVLMLAGGCGPSSRTSAQALAAVAMGQPSTTPVTTSPEAWAMLDRFDAAGGGNGGGGVQVSIPDVHGHGGITVDLDASQLRGVAGRTDERMRAVARGVRHFLQAASAGSAEACCGPIEITSCVVVVPGAQREPSALDRTLEVRCSAGPNLELSFTITDGVVVAVDTAGIVRSAMQLSTPR